MQMNYVLQGRQDTFEPTNASVPTLAQPGSDEKVRVLMERYRQGQALHHPGDIASSDLRYNAGNEFEILTGGRGKNEY